MDPYPAGNYLLKVKYRNTRTWCKICLKLKIKKPCPSVSVVNFEHVIADLLFLKCPHSIETFEKFIFCSVRKRRSIFFTCEYYGIIEPYESVLDTRQQISIQMFLTGVVVQLLSLRRQYQFKVSSKSSSCQGDECVQSYN